MDFKLLSAEITKIVRKGKSQEWLARRVGISKTQIHRWETGKNEIRWDKFLIICNLTHNKVDTVLPKIFKLDGINSDIGFYLKIIINKNSLNDVVQKTGYSKQSLKRWIDGEALPTLSQILTIWYKYSTHSFYLFLDEFIGLAKISSIHQISKKWSLEKKISKKYPYIAGILKLAARNLTSDELKERAKNSFGIEDSEYNELIKKLIDIDILKQNRNKIYLVGHHLFDSSQNYELLCYLNDYWCKHTAKKISENQTKSVPGTFSYLVMNLSKSELLELKNDLYALNLKARQMSKNDEKDCVDTFVFTVQFTTI